MPDPTRGSNKTVAPSPHFRIRVMHSPFRRLARWRRIPHACSGSKGDNHGHPLRFLRLFSSPVYSRCRPAGWHRASGDSIRSAGVQGFQRSSRLVYVDLFHGSHGFFLKSGQELNIHYRVVSLDLNKPFLFQIFIYIHRSYGDR